jgi:pyruvate dehydrogenase E2 component (dihydrolipoamide acetyltransferase)
MASRVIMPKLTDTMTEGRLVKWFKQEGDRIESGDLLAEIETDKAVMDLEAYASGVLRKIIVPADRTVPAGSLVAIIADTKEDIAGILAETSETDPQKSVFKKPLPKTAASSAAPPTGRAERNTDASPLVRRMAEEHGIDLSKVQGTGPDGKIVKRDVEAYLERKPRPSAGQPAPAEYDEKELSMIRKAIARTMVQSKAPVPHFYVTIEVEMAPLLDLKKDLEQKNSRIKVTITDFLIKAAALTLSRHPDVNVAYIAADRSERLRRYEVIHIGVAVGLEEGIVAPVVRDCQKKSLSQIAQATKELIQRAKDRKLLPEDYSGGTFSISNLGMFDVDSFSAILTPPQAAAIAIGAVRESPVVENGGMKIGHRMKITMSCDHRAIDGLQAAKFLADLKKFLENPAGLVADRL